MKQREEYIYYIQLNSEEKIWKVQDVEIDEPTNFIKFVVISQAGKELHYAYPMSAVKFTMSKLKEVKEEISEAD